MVRARYLFATRHSPFAVLSPHCRQDHAKAAAAAVGREAHRIAAVVARNLAHQRETEAAAAAALGGARQPMERLENFLALAFRNAGTAVAHFDPGMGVRRAADPHVGRGFAAIPPRVL